MPDVINLRQARKRRERAKKERTAEQNRLLHGRTKTEKAKDRQTAERSVRFIDGHKREHPDEETRQNGDGKK